MSEQTIEYPYLVAPAVVEEFQRKGFVVTKDVFTPSTKLNPLIIVLAGTFE